MARGPEGDAASGQRLVTTALLESLLAGSDDALESLPAGVIPALLGELAAVSQKLSARLMADALRDRSLEASAGPVQLLSAKEAAKRIGGTVHQVYELMRRRELKFVQAGKYKRVSLAALEQWVARKEGGGLEPERLRETRGTSRRQSDHA